jgi:ATP-dependent RNA helicase SUPV3L1/SUV3
MLRYLLKQGEENILYSKNLKLLWECCQIPDFEKKAYDQHVNVIDNVFKFLSTRKKRIPNDYMKEQLKGLEKNHGNIDVLAHRISNVRTWAYVANKKNWVENADYWIQLTKNIEDNLSDKLHEELTKSFIDKKISLLSKSLKQDIVLKTEITNDDKVLIDDQYIGNLKGLKFNVEYTSKTLDTDIKSIKKASRKGVNQELIKRAENIIKEKKISYENDNKIYWKNNAIARIKKGPDYLNPEIEVLADDALPQNIRDNLEEFIQNWLASYINEQLGDLINLTKIKIKDQYLRALVFQMFENNGIIKRKEVDHIIKLISKEERKKLWAMGIKLGRYHVFLPRMLKPKAVNVRVNLWKLFYDISSKTNIPKFGLNFIINDNSDKKFLLICGFENFRNFFVRVDILEKLFINILEKTKERKFKISSDMMNLLGCSKENLLKLMNLMNYKKDKEEDTYIFYGERKVNKKIVKNKKIDSPFNKLLALNIK